MGTKLSTVKERHRINKEGPYDEPMTRAAPVGPDMRTTGLVFVGGWGRAQGRYCPVAKDEAEKAKFGVLETESTAWGGSEG